MRALLTSLTCLLILPAVAEGQAIHSLEQELRGLDPDTSVFISAETGVTPSWAVVTITDGWYNLRCYQRERFAKRIQGLWRKVYGDNTALLALEDRYGERVAESGWMGDISVESCD